MFWKVNSIYFFFLISLLHSQNFQQPSLADSTQHTFNSTESENNLLNFSNYNSSWNIQSKEILNLPFRSIERILSLYPEYVIQDGEAHLRGSRSGEIGYYLEGMNVRNLVMGGFHDMLIPEVIKSLEINAGHYSVNFGNAVAGIVRQTMRTGANRIEANLNFRGEPVSAGTDLGGSYANGYQNAVLLIEGPIISKDLRFLLAQEFHYQEDQNPRFYSPFAYYDQSAYTWAFDDTLLNVIWDGKIAPQNSIERYKTNGNLFYRYEDLTFKVIGAYKWQKAYQNQAPIGEIFNDRAGYLQDQSLFLNAIVKYELGKKYSAEFQAGYWNNIRETYDDWFGNNFNSWYDINGNYPHPWIINDFYFNSAGTPIFDDYSKDRQESLNFSLDLKANLANKITFAAGIDYQSYVLRHYSIYVPNFLNEDEFYSDDELGLNNRVDNYGYDVFGQTTVDNGIYGAKKPVYGGIYLNTIYRKDNLYIEAGLRWDYLDADDKAFKDPGNPCMKNGLILEEAYFDVDPTIKLSPRFSANIPLSNKIIAYTSYGKYFQMSKGLDRYLGNYRLSSDISWTYNLNPVGLNLKPVESANFEIGIRSNSSIIKFKAGIFFRQTKNQSDPTLNYSPLSDPVTGYYGLGNRIFSQAKGITIDIDVKPNNNIRSRISYAYTDAEGIGSYSYDGIAPLVQNSNKPTTSFPLSYSYKHKGIVSFEYRLGKNEGGPILDQSGFLLLGNFSSGHPFSLKAFQWGSYSLGKGTVAVEVDPRIGQPIVPVNSSTTIDQFTLDLRIDKTFSIANIFDIKIYFDVLNILNNKSDVNVYEVSGYSSTDGFIEYFTNLYGPNFKNIFGEHIYDFYRDINLLNANSYNGMVQNEMWDTPRQIRLGLEIKY